MATGERIRRRRRGGFELRLPGSERDLLRSLSRQLRELLAEGDPSLARLFPPAYEDDDERDAEYRSMTRDDLVAGRLASLDVLEETADSEQLDEEQLGAWLHALNDLRLVLGTKLDVSEDLEEESARASGPDAESMALYSYLGWLVEQAVEALSPRGRFPASF
jgi:alkanesulfonate monooxygenase SsuD/methylene tetrahydromethanopterin reductase-like flavin-dependent oxidoreductase (luciferase family)